MTRVTEDSLARDLSNLFASNQHARLMMEYVAEWDDVFDNTEKFPLFPGRALTVYEKGWSNWQCYVDCLLVAREEISIGEWVNAFQIICHALCSFYCAADEAYSNRKKEMQTQDGVRQKTRREEVRKFFSHLKGAKKAVSKLHSKGWISSTADEVASFHETVDGFVCEVEERFPSVGPKYAHSKQTQTDLSRALVWLFVRIGFDGHQKEFSVTKGIRYACLMAETHAPSVKVASESMRVYARELSMIDKNW